MNLWIRLDVSSPREPKVLGIASELDLDPMHAYGLTVATWCAVGEHAPDGDLAGIPDLVLESWAGWRGVRGAYAKAFRGAFMDGDRMPGWDRLQGKLIALAEKDRSRKGEATERPRKILGTSVSTRQDTTEQNTTEPTSTPQPPPTAATATSNRAPAGAAGGKSRKKAPAPCPFWLEPMREAWETHRGGPFDHGQAMRWCGRLRSEFKLSPAEMGEFFTNYLSWFGNPDYAAGDLRSDEITRRTFRPNLKAFSEAFLQFDGKGPSDAAFLPEYTRDRMAELRARSAPPDALVPAIVSTGGRPDDLWAHEVAALWVSEVGALDPRTVRRDLEASHRVYGVAALLAAVRFFAEHRRRHLRAGDDKPRGWPQFVSELRDFVPPDLLPTGSVDEAA